MTSLRALLRPLSAIALLAGCAHGVQQQPQQQQQQQPTARPADDAALVARPRAIHQRVMTLDTHVESSGESAVTYTRMRAPYVNPDVCRIRSRTVTSRLG